MKKQHVIIGLGEILWDLFPEGKKLGGAPTNFAYHCKQMGAASYVISAIGNDDLGHEIIERSRALDLDHTLISIDKQHPTGTVSVKVDSKGHPEYTIHTGVAWDHIPLSDDALRLASDASALCFGSLAQRTKHSRETLRSILKASPPGCLRIFDINLRQDYYSTDLIQQSLELATILKLNDDEFEVISELLSMEGSEESRLHHLLREFSLELVALTKGPEGSTLFGSKEFSEYRSEPASVVDSVGAGDSFTAALAMGLLNKVSLRSIHKAASDLAAYICTRQGATPEVPTDLIKDIQKI